MSFMKVDFAHPLTITRFSVFSAYIKENRKEIEKASIPQLLLSGAVSLMLTPARGLENLLFDRTAKKVEVRRPLFVLGHWRSGTTLVQQLLARDPQFGFLDPLMNFTFNFYHILGWAFRNVIASNLDMGRPMDNMKYAMDLPLEEYIVFSTISKNGVYPLNFFPQAFLKYNRFAYVDQMPSAQQTEWIRKYRFLLQKLTALNDGKPLMLKSPDNTARVRLLKKLYPDAKFVNIYRDPYAVVRSTIHLYQKMIPTWSLEAMPDEETLEDWVIRTFKEMYLSYFEEKKTLSPSDLFEIRFEDFEKDPMPILRKMYETLELPGFDEACPLILRHWEGQSGYKKNEFAYADRLIRKVNENLGFYFEHYGYKMR